MQNHTDKEMEEKNVADTAKQEQSDSQETELKGFVDGSEDLEPTLTDGTKSPDKVLDDNK